MNLPALSKATAFVALACAWLTAQSLLGQRQELTRIAPPAEESPAAPSQEPTYYQSSLYEPSIYRFAEYAQSEYEQTNVEAAVPPPAPLAATEPAYGATGSYGKYGYDDCCCKLTGFVGIESTFLFPLIEDAPSSVRILENGGPDPLYTTDEVELDDEIFYSPRIWAGVQCCGWGVVSRLFWLDGSESRFTPETPFFLQSHTSNSRLEAFTFDLEGFHKWFKDDCCCDERYLSFGFRYASLEASELIEAHGEVGGDFVQGLALTEREMTGPGITGAFGGSHVMASCPAVQMYFNLRGSFAWVDISKGAQTTAWAFDPSIVPGTAMNFSTALVETSDAAFIGEIQLGVQWNHQLECCCGRFFLRGGIEYQYWNADAGFAAAGSEAFTDGAIVTSLATADGFKLDLIGLSIGTGLLY